MPSWRYSRMVQRTSRTKSSAATDSLTSMFSIAYLAALSGSWDEVSRRSAIWWNAGFLHTGQIVFTYICIRPDIFARRRGNKNLEENYLKNSIIVYIAVCRKNSKLINSKHYTAKQFSQKHLVFADIESCLKVPSLFFSHPTVFFFRLSSACCSDSCFSLSDQRKGRAG